MIFLQSSTQLHPNAPMYIWNLGVPGLAKSDRLTLFSKAGHTEIVLMAGNKKAASLSLPRTLRAASEHPRIVHSGKDYFLVLVTASKTEIFEDFVRINGKQHKLAVPRPFLNSWSTNFDKTGVVFEFTTTHLLTGHSGNVPGWIGKGWKWDAKSAAFISIPPKAVVRPPDSVLKRFAPRRLMRPPIQ